MSLSSNALVTAEQVWSTLGWTAGQHPEALAAIEAIIEGVSVQIRDGVACDLSSAIYTAQAIDGSGKSYLYLPNWPVTLMAVGTLSENGTVLVMNTDFFLDYDYGILTKAQAFWYSGDPAMASSVTSGPRWTSIKRGIVATYTAGYVTVPADIKQACLVEVARAYEIGRKKIWGQESHTSDGQSSSTNLDALLPSTMTTLGKYTRPRV
jgi:hypothetical protein